MAAVVTETKVALLDGGPNGKILVCGTAVLDGGTTTFTINPGSNTVNLTAPETSRGLRNITGFNVTCSTAQNATKAACVPTYNATTDNWTIVVTCVADQSYDWHVEGLTMGQ